ncbi:MAG: membrane protein insertase YidC [Verrucomicrobiae bacterium]|nr:membrane protein insertase YidC [Verrucomicrobiae bacterium]
MDKKSIIVVVICLLLIVFWFPLVNKIWPPKPIERSTNVVSTTAPQITNGTTTSTSAVVATQSVTTSPSIKETSPIVVPPGTKEQIEILETENARYVFTSFGGGLKYIELKHFPQTVDRSAKKKTTTNDVARLNAKAPAPVFALTGEKSGTDDTVYTLRRDGSILIAEKQLKNGLRIIKGFKPESNYLMRVEIRYENTTAEPLVVPPQLLIAGTATPMGPFDNETMLGFYYNDAGSVLRESASSFMGGGCSVRSPLTRFESKQGNIIWSAAHNQFFAIAVMSRQPARQLFADKIQLPPPTSEERELYPRAQQNQFGLQTSLLFPAIILGNEGTNRFVDRKFILYAGPKEYKTLSDLAYKENNKLDEIMGFNNVLGGRFTGFFAKALLLSMNWIHETFKLSYGLCIIAITIIIKVLFWPLTQASTRSMKRMSALQPQMKAIQEKYKDNPQKMNQKLMEFMKENRVNPLGGCLPMMIQIPVFIGFYAMIQTAIELRGAQFLWAMDLSRPDTVAVILGFPINPIPIIMGLTMLWQSKLTPVSPGMDPTQQKILKYMPLMFMVFLYNMSSGLTLYWTVQNLLTIAQMKLTKTTEPKQDAAQQQIVQKPIKKK